MFPKNFQTKFGTEIGSHFFSFAFSLIDIHQQKKLGLFNNNKKKKRTCHDSRAKTISNIKKNFSENNITQNVSNKQNIMHVLRFFGHNHTATTTLTLLSFYLFSGEWLRYGWIGRSVTNQSTNQSTIHFIQTSAVCASYTASAN